MQICIVSTKPNLPSNLTGTSMYIQLLILPLMVNESYKNIVFP